jgi:hypothetical protein
MTRAAECLLCPEFKPKTHKKKKKRKKKKKGKEIKELNATQKFKENSEVFSSKKSFSYCLPFLSFFVVYCVCLF